MSDIDSEYDLDPPTQEAQHVRFLLSKAAGGIAKKLKTSPAEVLQALERMAEDYEGHMVWVERFENAAEAKKNLQKVAKMADKLVEKIDALGEGAVAEMNRLVDCQDEDADPSGLPKYHSRESMFDIVDARRPRGRWVARLSALSNLAKRSACVIGEMAAKGGSKNLGEHLYKLPQDELARSCREFAMAHGCYTQPVIQKMVQAVMEYIEGHHAMLNLYGEYMRSKGRKAVRKVAQTKPKCEAPGP